MSDSLVQALVTAPHTHTLRAVRIYGLDVRDCELAFHFLLCSLPGLEVFDVCGTLMLCDPRILEQTRWICSNLIHLTVKPNCDAGENYSTQRVSRRVHEAGWVA